jgi:thioredoxin reductase
MKDKQQFDVIIIGGSYAGLSAAMALGRSLKKVLVLDSGLPCNRQTPHSHNFITHDGEKPAEISRKAKEQVLKYSTVTFMTELAVGGKKIDKGFIITTKSGHEFQCSKLIIASGVKDLMPDIKGFKECWGISVVHCPYCHGYELKGKKTGIYANGEKAFHLASLVNNLTDDITLLPSAKLDLTAEQKEKIAKHKIEIVETEIAEIEHSSGQLKSIVFKDGSKMQLDGLYAAIPFQQHCEVPEALGCELTEHGHIKINEYQKTSVDGIFACGDSTTMMRSVANAVHSGNLTGAIVNMEITSENF